MHWILGVAVMLLLVARLVSAASRALEQPPLLGPESMIGTFGLARTDLAPDGQVEVMGARWRARTQGRPIAQGAWVKISSASGLMLIVESADPPDPGKGCPTNWGQSPVHAPTSPLVAGAAGAAASAASGASRQGTSTEGGRNT